MNWLAESIVALWFLPVVLCIVLPLTFMACHLGLSILKGMFGRQGNERVLITKEMGAGV